MGKLNYVYRIGKFAKSLWKTLYVLAFILPLSLNDIILLFTRACAGCLYISNSLQLKVLECQPLPAGVSISPYFEVKEKNSINFL